MERIRSAAFLSCAGLQLSDQEKFLFERFYPAGVTLFGRNIKDSIQIKQLIKQIKEVSGEDTLIAVDQEGGRVCRLKGPEFRRYVSQGQLGQRPESEAKEMVKMHAELISADLKELGVDVNFAPVLDVLHQETTAALGNRCFSDRAETVGNLGMQMVKAYIKSGIIPCIKHLPGHGLAVCDPHLGLPIIDAQIDVLEQEFAPFRKCNFAPMGMTAHILLTAIDKENPITQSKKGIEEIIRKTIGFEGFLISDAIDMNALKGNIVERAQKSLQAGCDCVCYCMGKIEEMEALAKNFPQLSEGAQQRLDKAKQVLHNGSVNYDTTVLAQKYGAMDNEKYVYDEKYDATEVLHKMEVNLKC